MSSGPPSQRAARRFAKVFGAEPRPAPKTVGPPRALSVSARDGLERAGERAPVTAWKELRRYLAMQWQPGEHISIFGPTGSGKTTILIELCELPGHQPAIMLVTKKRDELVGRLARRGWVVCHTLEAVERACKLSLRERWAGKREVDSLIVYWPTSTGTIRQRRARLTSECERFLDWGYTRGRLTIGVDEALFVCEDLKLGASMRMLWHEGRASGVSLLAASQRPSWLPKSAYSAPTYLSIFRTADPDDLKRLADIGGALDTRGLRQELQLLRKHQFAFCAPRDDPAWVVRSTVERGRDAA